MSENKTRMTTKTAKLYGLKTLGSPFMFILLALIIYFAYMSYSEPSFFELFIILLGIYLLWPLLNVFSIPRKDVTLTDRVIIVSYDKALKDDKTIPVDDIKDIIVKRSFLGDRLNYQDLIITKMTDEREIITGLSDAEMLVNMVKQIAEEKKLEQMKKEVKNKPKEEKDFTFTNHN